MTRVRTFLFLLLFLSIALPAFSQERRETEGYSRAIASGTNTIVIKPGRDLWRYSIVISGGVSTDSVTVTFFNSTQTDSTSWKIPGPNGTTERIVQCIAGPRITSAGGIRVTKAAAQGFFILGTY